MRKYVKTPHSALKDNSFNINDVEINYYSWVDENLSIKQIPVHRTLKTIQVMTEGKYNLVTTMPFEVGMKYFNESAKADHNSNTTRAIANSLLGFITSDRIDKVYILCSKTTAKFFKEMIPTLHQMDILYYAKNEFTFITNDERVLGYTHFRQVLELLKHDGTNIVDPLCGFGSDLLELQKDSNYEIKLWLSDFNIKAVNQAINNYKILKGDWEYD